MSDMKAQTLVIGKDIERKKLDFKQYVRRTAYESDYKELIKGNLIIVNPETNRPLLVYLSIQSMPTVKMINTLKSINYTENKRLSGMTNRGKLFGYMPREQIRKDYCSSTALARENPEGHRYVCEFGKLLSEWYEHYCPETYADHMKLTSNKILSDWRIHGSPFTSGIINKNNMLKYHFDAGNIRNVYSNMVCFKKDCKGGFLSLPEFDIGLEIANKSVLFFDGQQILHGVTPFKLTSREAYRFTLVYYTLQQMWACNTVTEELARIRERKYLREQQRYKRLTGELKDDDKYQQKRWKAKSQYPNTKQNSKQDQKDIIITS